LTISATVMTVGTQWMSWTMVGSLAVCIPVLFLLRESYKRLDIDVPVMLNTDELSEPWRDNDFAFHHQHSVSANSDVSLSEPH